MRPSGLAVINGPKRLLNRRKFYKFRFLLGQIPKMTTMPYVNVQ